MTWTLDDGSSPFPTRLTWSSCPSLPEYVSGCDLNRQDGLGVASVVDNAWTVFPHIQLEDLLVEGARHHSAIAHTVTFSATYDHA